MSKYYKNLDKALKQLERSTFGYDDIDAVKQAYEALIKLLDNELDIRQNRLWPRVKQKYRCINDLSSQTLVAHKGWALRMLDSIRVYGSNTGYMSTQNRAKEAICFGRDYILNQRQLFIEPMNESVFHRAFAAAKAKVKKLFAKKPKDDFITYKSSDPLTFKSIEISESEAVANARKL